MKKYFIDKDSSDEEEVNFHELTFDRENLIVCYNSYSLVSYERFYEIFQDEIHEEINDQLYEDWKDAVSNDQTTDGYDYYYDKYYSDYADYFDLRDYEKYFKGESNIGYFYDGNLFITDIDFYGDLKNCEKLSYFKYKFNSIEEYENFFNKINELYIDFDKCVEIAESFLEYDESRYKAFFSKIKLKKLILK